MQKILKRLFYLNTEEKEIYPLYTLRFIFFVFIFVHHCYENVEVPLLRQPTLAVSAFIILSGFLNGYIYIKKDYKIKEFLKFTYNRIKKLYPLHIILLLISIPLSGVFNLSGGSDFLEFGKRIFCNTLLIQSWVNDPAYYFSFNGVAWFLSAYMFLSLLTLPIMSILKRINRTKHRNILLVSISIVLFMITVFIVYI